jgi:hypothetical protein
VKDPIVLAPKLPSKMCAELSDFIRKVIASAEFRACHCQSEKDFTRQRKLPFHVLIAFLINFVLCARISCTKWKAVRKFFYSNLTEKIICLPIHATSVAQCKEMSLIGSR